MTTTLDLQTILDGFGHGVLIFDSSGQLVLSNQGAGTILGTDLNLIKSDGWEAAHTLLDSGLSANDKRAEAVKQEALLADKPVRFRIFRSGTYIPCAASALGGTDGTLYLMITLDVADWSFLRDVIDRFRTEMRDTIESTSGHIELIQKTIESTVAQEDIAAARMAKRISGFTRLIGLHMNRANRLMNLLERLEDIRTGRVKELARQERRKIAVAEFVEDFVEELSELKDFLDPETEVQDYRSRIILQLPDTPDLAVDASRRYLTNTLQEVLRNAIMYSLRGTNITLKVHVSERGVQFDVTDEGYGIRSNDHDSVFRAFVRGRQPQILSEFGYGLCLHICKHEIEAMNGRMWFTSDENVGTTLRFMLPRWRSASSTSDNL